MAANGREIIQRYDKLNDEAGNHRDEWERMAPYIAPSRKGMYGRTPGEKQTGGVYDSTSMMAAELMAMFIVGHINNPSQLWQNWEMEDPNAGDQTREWLEECRDLTLKRLSKSLFYAESTETFVDYGGFGTGFLMCEEAPQPVNQTIRGFRGFLYTAFKTGEFLIQDGPDGLVDTAFHKYQASARVAAARWGRANLPENVTRALDEGQQDRLFDFIHAIYPRPKIDIGYGNKGMPWASCWVEYNSKHVVLESGYRVFPASIPRYHRTPGEVFGRGRGQLAYPDTWTLNTAKRMGFEDWALKIRPTMMHAHDSVFGTLQMIPGGHVSVNAHGKDIRHAIMPYETGSSPEVSQIKEEELRKSIRSIFFVDQILALLEIEKSEMTAFEFAKKIELLFRLMGPVYGRCEREYLHRNSEIMWDVQMHAGAFPPPPPEIANTNGIINTIFQNPITRAQRAGDAESLMMNINDVAPIAQNNPSMWDWHDGDKIMLGDMRIRGVPSSWTRSLEEVMKLREERAKQQQADLEMQRMTEAAKAAGAAAPAMKQMMVGGGMLAA